MSQSEQNADETQLETLTEETQYVETRDLEPGNLQEDGVVAPQQKRKKPEKKEVLVREPGKTLFPMSRVQKIIKADKEIPIIAKDATFLISIATEEMIKRLCEAGQQVAHREKRSTVQHKDIATVVRKADEFLFLKEIMAWTSAEPAVKRAKPKGKGVAASGPTLLDSFVVKAAVETEDVIMNEDGTMYAADSS